MVELEICFQTGLMHLLTLTAIPCMISAHERRVICLYRQGNKLTLIKSINNPTVL
jgi:hypothetical protein